MRDLFRSSALALILTAAIAGASAAQQPEQKQAPALSNDGEVSPGARDAAKSILKNTPGLAGPESGGASEQGGEKKDAASGDGTNNPVENAQGGQGHPAPMQTIGPPNAGPVPLRGEGFDLPGVTAETAPAKYSEENAKLDEYSIMGYPLQLSDEQRQAILSAIGERSETASTLGRTVHAEAGVFLPPNVEAEELPATLNQQIPEIRGLKYVKTDDGILLVAPANGIVRGVVSE